MDGMKEESLDAMVEKAFARERLSNLDRRFLHPPYVLECMLREKIIEGELEAARAVLKEINGMERARLAGDRMRSLKNSLIASCTFITRAAIDGGVDAELAFTLSDTFIRRIEAGREEEELALFEESMLSEFVALVLRYRCDPHDILVSRAIRLVKARLTEEISLAGTAAALGVSGAYLSGQFSRKLGISFITYVQRLKMEEAKHFLRSTSLDIMEIAQTLGFTYQAYFTRVFRKTVGMTPSEYRRRAAGG
jgi:AraC-like DNA-binding protein